MPPAQRFATRGTAPFERARLPERRGARPDNAAQISDIHHFPDVKMPDERKSSLSPSFQTGKQVKPARPHGADQAAETSLDNRGPLRHIHASQCTDVCKRSIETGNCNEHRDHAVYTAQHRGDKPQAHERTRRERPRATGKCDERWDISPAKRHANRHQHKSGPQ